MFINRYLGQAPDLKHNYQIWIARYGEYKPDVKLAVWQLSPNGRVRGIQGEVDINMFNGYANQFQEFLKQETIQ
jgi:lysozyme